MNSHSMISIRRVLLASAVALTAFAADVSAQTYDFKVLHSFSGSPNDGDGANTSVRFDSAGNLYGTTWMGGANGAGTIYKIANDGTESILYSFGPLPDGSYLAQTLGIVIDPATGDIYGTTKYGGDNNCPLSPPNEGCGVIYKLAPDGTFTVLHAFDGVHDGGFPSSVILDAAGNLYGATQSGGGDDGGGTVFEYGADGTFTVLHTFKIHSDNFSPALIPMVRDNAGNLYGLTTLGYNTNNCGALYKLAPDGTFIVLHAFGNHPGYDDGCGPTSLAGDQATNTIYGTTTLLSLSTSSTIFKIAPDSRFTTLYRTDAQLGAVLPVNGTLYGTAYGNYGAGRDWAIFKIASDGTYHELYFSWQTDVLPAGRLNLKNGRLYGTIYMYPWGSSGPDSVFSFGVSPQ